MVRAKQGFLPLQGAGQVRVRQPASAEAVWRKFAQAPAAVPEADGAPSKKKMRPNERFATKLPAEEATVDESELFWEAQRSIRGAAAELPPAPDPPPEPAAPDKPA